jgi:RimJ/RimL family protein N-acetyltransferase
MIHAGRLELVDVEARHKLAFAASRAELGQMLGVRLPDSWPAFPEAFTPTRADTLASPSGWGGYFFLDLAEDALIGNGGFHGPPADTGVVEIGYEVAPEFRNRGYAREAVKGLLAFAFADFRVRCVVAHTLADTNPSTAVLVRLGFVHVAELANPEVGRVWRWELERRPGGAS